MGGGNLLNGTIRSNQFLIFVSNVIFWFLLFSNESDSFVSGKKLEWLKMREGAKREKIETTMRSIEQLNHSTLLFSGRYFLFPASGDGSSGRSIDYFWGEPGFESHEWYSLFSSSVKNPNIKLLTALMLCLVPVPESQKTLIASGSCQFVKRSWSNAAFVM